MFRRADHESGKQGGLSLHDPLAVWYAIAGQDNSEWKVKRDVDLRVETTGQWTRGAAVTDKRPKAERKRAEDPDVERPVKGDQGGWLSERRGNRVNVVVGTPVEEEGRFGVVMCMGIFEGVN